MESAAKPDNIIFLYIYIISAVSCMVTGVSGLGKLVFFNTAWKIFLFFTKGTMSDVLKSYHVKISELYVMMDLLTTILQCYMFLPDQDWKILLVISLCHVIGVCVGFVLVPQRVFAVTVCIQIVLFSIFAWAVIYECRRALMCFKVKRLSSLARSSWFDLIYSGHDNSKHFFQSKSLPFPTGYKSLVYSFVFGIISSIYLVYAGNADAFLFLYVFFFRLDKDQSIATMVWISLLRSIASVIYSLIYLSPDSTYFIFFFVSIMSGFLGILLSKIISPLITEVSYYHLLIFIILWEIIHYFDLPYMSLVFIFFSWLFFLSIDLVACWAFASHPFFSNCFSIPRTGSSVGEPKPLAAESSQLDDVRYYGDFADTSINPDLNMVGLEVKMSTPVPIMCSKEKTLKKKKQKDYYYSTMSPSSPTVKEDQLFSADNSYYASVFDEVEVKCMGEEGSSQEEYVQSEGDESDEHTGSSDREYYH
ncbi:uncharacterized protein LOC126322726 [Schistocerca gregaria]|uniref:uncharacterized protein LOC126322726 n=1 Tax=Schistocerca gregaria TaxID=7010 RepID=UPI00211F1C29|nr:uncharacterized protein LOC126322726 [Schistocerca gregaria]